MEHIFFEHISNKSRKFVGNKNVLTNIYRAQAYDLIISGYFCIGFNDFMLKGKNLLACTIYFLLMNIKRMIK